MNELSKRLRAALKQPNFVGRQKRSSFYPSSASVVIDTPAGKKVIGACLRQQYYDYFSEPASNEGEIDYSISAAMGDKVTELLVQFIDSYGFQLGLQRLATEHRIYDERINISGRSDILLWDHINKEPIGVEVKSVGEYKATKTMEQPAAEHILQAVLYLDYYKTYMPEKQTIPKKWYIWYFSRTENYSIKAKKHGSPLTMLWDYYITLDNDGIPTIHGSAKTKKLPEFSVSNIHKRYKELANYIDSLELPPRDYELEYSPEKITSLFKLDLLSRKADKEAVEKWLAKGAQEGKLKIKMGDFECQLCEWRDKCWNLSQTKMDTSISNLPEKVDEKKPENKIFMW